ncbi:lysosomal Pro-X carboxypeptidase-like [Telopea speciosissima]|uniref:lysosomal Pro-X carboxypeptidase-like n=1 Tax=Telopea speciosissima TaxID=54955 RepID=UPI001CC82AD8|nr:lysosomal Pro-X carboxypeptidase-like [Telopea speciosissima]
MHGSMYRYRIVRIQGSVPALRLANTISNTVQTRERLNTARLPRLGVVDRSTRRVKNHEDVVAASTSSDFETFFYTQTLDHFNYRPESYKTFQQKYVVNFKYWGGANSSAPIFAYLGEESPLDQDLGVIGLLNDNAPQFKALLLYIEHRYYGKSIPFGSREEAFQNASTLGYFSSSQALADYAEVILDLKKNFSAEASPVIVFGGSYGGMLASWFRLKYPHIAYGALASSAPILYFDNITPEDGYLSVVTKDFREASESCYNTIRQVWSEIDNVASQTNGLKFLSQKFKTCSPLNTTYDLIDYLESTYTSAAQYNSPPRYPVSMICKGIDEASEGTDILSRIFAGLVAYWGNLSCYDTNVFNYPSETSEGWSWQTCSEMVMPIGSGSNDTMFPGSPFNLSSFIEDCKDSYGVSPRPHWITTQFGGHDIKRVLKRFGSNIIFSNGLKDPYSSGGVLENISPSLVAIHTKNGSHCLDIVNSLPDDPEWLVEQRNTEIRIIAGWLVKYYMDLAEKLW